MRLSLLAALIALAPAAHADEITIFAAASLKTALDQIAANWQAAQGDTVVISYAGSSQLAKQIQQGAPADLFISASTGWMDAVQDSDNIDPATRRDLLGNTLVLVGTGKPAEAPIADLPALLGDAKLAMAMVDSVPAGQYGKAALESLGLWENVAPSVAQADNVRSALALVALGEAPYGIVYATDAHAEPKVHVVGTFPKGSYPPAIYPAALLKGAADPADKAFFDALSAPEADAIFAAQGFKVPE